MPKIQPRRVLAVNAGRAAAIASRLLGRGGGTAFPGLVAQQLDPSIARSLSQQLRLGSIIVSGTNGKTTTCRMLAQILADAGLSPLRNESGSNLMRGVAASLVMQANVLGNLPANRGAFGLFEVDEAALPGVLSALEPATILLLDLFRDQLDRYGEVATIARLWAEALRGCPASTLLVVNADDPLLASAAESAPGPVAYFGIDSADAKSAKLEHAADVKACPRCGGAITYSAVQFGHLGHYKCQQCALSRPNPTLEGRAVRLLGIAGSNFTIAIENQEASVTLPLPGLYNVYNALAAATVAHSHGIALDDIATSLASVTPAFGRMESVSVDGGEVYIALVKNPAGLNEVMRTALQDGLQLNLLVLLNDNTADGHDVSWIWDADVEMLAGHIESVVFSGIRAADMALRFKYAGAIGSTMERFEIMESAETALDRALSWTPRDKRLFIVPTYTAMLDIRGVLARQGYLRPYWEE